MLPDSFILDNVSLCRRRRVCLSSVGPHSPLLPPFPDPSLSPLLDLHVEYLSLLPCTRTYRPTHLALSKAGNSSPALSSPLCLRAFVLARLPDDKLIYRAVVCFSDHHDSHSHYFLTILSTQAPYYDYHSFLSHLLDLLGSRSYFPFFFPVKIYQFSSFGHPKCTSKLTHHHY